MRIFIKIILLLFLLYLPTLNANTELQVLIKKNVSEATKNYNKIISSEETYNLWIQVSNRNQEKNVSSIISNIQGMKIKQGSLKVHSIQLVKTSRKNTSLRYYKNGDRHKAIGLISNLEKFIPGIKIEDYSKKYKNAKWIKPGHFELWLSHHAVFTNIKPPATSKKIKSKTLININKAMNLVDKLGYEIRSFKNPVLKSKVFNELKNIKKNLEHHKKSNYRNISTREAYFLYNETIMLSYILRNTANTCQGNPQKLIMSAIKSANSKLLTSCMLKLKSLNFYSNSHAPLGSAAFHGNLDYVRLFVAWGANINQVSKDKTNKTPLHFAIQKNRIEVAKFLLCNGANKKALNAASKSPMDYDIDNMYANVVCP